MATIIHHDGREEEVQPANGHTFALADLQRIVALDTDQERGYIEIVPTKDGRIIVLNEEGKLWGLPINVKASELADLPTEADLAALREQLGDALIIVADENPLHGPDVIVGCVLVCEASEVE